MFPAQSCGDSPPVARRVVDEARPSHGAAGVGAFAAAAQVAVRSGVCCGASEPPFQPCGDGKVLCRMWRDASGGKPATEGWLVRRFFGLIDSCGRVCSQVLPAEFRERGRVCPQESGSSAHQRRRPVASPRYALGHGRKCLRLSDTQTTHRRHFVPGADSVALCHDRDRVARNPRNRPELGTHT